MAFQLVKNGISAICMHTNLDAAEGGVNEVLAGIFVMREMGAFAEGCGRVGSIEPVTVPELAKRHRKSLPPAAISRSTALRCRSSSPTPAKQCGGWPSSAAQGKPLRGRHRAGADCLLTGEANHHHAIDAKRLGLSLIAAGHYATEFPVTAAVAEKLRTAFPELEVLVSEDARDPYTYL